METDRSNVKVDRELLELAAKAAGISIDKSETNGGGVGNNGFSITGDAMLDWHNNILWNPLTDDGDALRLAVKLGITMYPPEGEHDGATTTWAYPDSEWITVDRTEDPCADMRRAIVRAAAAIGEQMP